MCLFYFCNSDLSLYALKSKRHFHNMLKDNASDIFAIMISTYTVISDGNPDAKRLYDEILSGYNKLVTLSLSSKISKFVQQIQYTKYKIQHAGNTFTP